MHSTLATTLAIAATLATVASAAQLPESYLTTRDAELEEALLELQARDAEASQYDELLEELYARDPDAFAEADPKIHINGKKVLNGLKGFGKGLLSIFGRDAEPDEDLLANYARDAEAFAYGGNDDEILGELYVREASTDAEADFEEELYIREADPEAWME